MQKRRDMRRTDWKRILKRDYVWDRCVYQGIEGIAALIVIREITHPLTVRNGNHEVTIVDKEMAWLQIALRDQYVWVTAMFDKNGQLLQIYFDLTNGNCLEPADNPTFEDLYLDIVMEPSGQLYLLDEDELEEAFAAGEITEKQYQRTIDEGQQLHRWLTEHGQDFAEFCCDQMRKLKGMQANGKD